MKMTSEQLVRELEGYEKEVLKNASDYNVAGQKCVQKFSKGLSMVKHGVVEIQNAIDEMEKY